MVGELSEFCDVGERRFANLGVLRVDQLLWACVFRMSTSLPTTSETLFKFCLTASQV